MMKRLFALSSFLVILSMAVGAQAPVMTSWQTATLNETELKFRMHDRSINNGYALCEIELDMSAAWSDSSASVVISVYENDGSGTYGSLRHTFSYDPGDGSSAFSVTEMTRILVVSSGGTEPLYARAVITGVNALNDFTLTTTDATTTIVTSDSYDPNEDTGSAATIASDATHDGLLVNADADVYEITVPSAYRNLVVDVNYLNDYRTSVAGLDLDLFLLNSSGIAIQSSISGATSTSAPISESLDEILDAGTYYIRISPKDSDPNRNFYTLSWDTLATPTYTISGNIQTGGTGLSGVSLSGLPGTPITDGSGNYTVQVDHGWDGTVTPTLAGYTFVPVSTTYSDVTSAQIQNYTATINTYTISGTIETAGAVALSGVTLGGLPGNPVTDVNGDYSATVDHGWSGTVTPTLAGYTFNPVSSTYSNVAAVQVQDYAATLNSYTISGTIETDGAVALPGVTMNGLPGNPVTDANGDYTANVDHGWSGTVTPTLTGYTFAPVSSTYSSVVAPQIRDYVATLNAYTISGTVETSPGTGLSGVVLSGLPGDPVSDLDGNYTVGVPHGWSGTVTPTLVGYTFVPVSVTHTNVVTAQVQDYTATLNTYTISGTVQEGDGTGITGVTMLGLPANPVTDVDGSYSATVTYGWGGTVTPTLVGYTFSPLSTTFSNVSSDQIQNYTAGLNTYGISGSILTGGGVAVAGVTMTGLPGNPITDANGYYSGNVEYGWSGTVVPILEGYTFDPVSTNYDNVTSPLAQDYTATINSYTISGTVATAGAVGLSGVTMDGLPGNPMTDVDGNYAADVDHGWSGTVTPTLEDYSFNPVSSNYSNVIGPLAQDYAAIRDPYLEIADTVVYLSDEAGANVLINVFSNIGWNVTCPETWISLSPDAGVDAGSFTITAETANGAIDTRSAIVSVSGEGLLITIDVTQSGSGPFLETSVSVLHLASTAGESGPVDIISNLDWSVTEGADWLSVAPLSGSGDGTLTITTDLANGLVTERSALVTVSGGGMTRDIEVRQEGADPVLEISTNTITLAAASGSTQSINITSNMDWTASETADWLTVAPATGSLDGSVTITSTSANGSTSPRSATVTIQGGSIAHFIDVVQTGADASLEVSAPTDTLAYTAGDYINLSISSNISWYITESVSWLSVSPTSGTGNRLVTILSDSENTSTSDRTGTVTVSGGGIIRTVNVTQKGKEPDPPVGIRNSQAAFGMKLFPNPARELIFFESSVNLESGVHLKVMDLTGRVVFLDELPHLVAGEPLEVNIAAYPPGTYLVLIRNKDVSEVYKFIKNK